MPDDTRVYQASQTSRLSKDNLDSKVVYFQIQAADTFFTFQRKDGNLWWMC